MKYSISFLFIITLQYKFCSFTHYHGKWRQQENTGSLGTPLILTPLIEQNKINEAVRKSQVSYNGFKGIKSYSGFFTVDKRYNSNMFFWYFPSQKDYENAPLILWLHGGPGASGLLGLFGENGPFMVKEDGLQLRPYAWTESHSVVYIDNPVGTGYSFTENGYAENETKVGEDLYNAMQQFFTMFPDLQKKEFYLAGDSYGGKFVPALAYTIHKKNPDTELKMNLKGLSIGNGWCDPENQVRYSDYLYQIGLIDANTRDEVKKVEQQGVKLIQEKEFIKSQEVFSNLYSYFTNVTGFTYYFNYLYAEDPYTTTFPLMVNYIQSNDVRKAIHVGNITFRALDSTVEQYLLSDIMQSVAPWISELLSHYRILMYSGQLDINVAYPYTLNFLQKLQFSAAAEYKTAPRYKWYVGKELAGYFKEAGNLTEVLVRNAGHVVPQDQPKWAFDLISRFTRNQQFQKTSE